MNNLLNWMESTRPHSLQRAMGACLFVAALVIANHAHAQYTTTTSVDRTGSASSYGSRQSYAVNLGNTPPGTLWDVTYVLTNTAGHPLRFVNPGMVATPAGVNLVSNDAAADVTLGPQESLTIPFQAGVPTTGAAASNTRVTISYDVIWVYDQIWRDGDFSNRSCGSFTGSTAPLALPVSAGGEVSDTITGGVTPGCSYKQNAIFTNDLNVPVTISYAGYSDDGSIAPYISGTLCGINSTKFCQITSDNWTGDITLQPGQSSNAFAMLLGMPWDVGNESRLTSGNFLFKWKIEESIPAPAAVNDVGETAHNTALTVNVLANDTLAPNVNHVVTLANTTSGTWVVNADNTVTYTPADGFTGTATAQYTVTGPDGQFATATITITVGAPVTPPPAAANDVGETAHNTALTVNVLANDTLAPNVNHVVTLANTTSGTWVVNADNTVTYTPADGFTGTATAQYTVTGPDGQFATATITIAVDAAVTPQAPTPVPALGAWPLALLALCMGMLGAVRSRKRPGA